MDPRDDCRPVAVIEAGYEPSDLVGRFQGPAAPQGWLYCHLRRWLLIATSTTLSGRRPETVPL